MEHKGMNRWVKQKYLLLVCTAAFLIFNGCAQVTMMRTRELRAVQYHVDSLKVELMLLQQQMAREQEAQSDMLRTIKAEQQVRFEELERSLSMITGSINDNQEKLSQINSKTVELKQNWDAKIRNDSIALVKKSQEVQTNLEKAVALFTNGNYDLAIIQFKELISRYPGSSQAEESLYWIGESLFLLTNYSEAELSFKDYVQKYPEGTKKSAALYKLGLVYEKMKKLKARDMVFNALIRQFPESEEAKSAKTKIGK